MTDFYITRAIDNSHFPAVITYRVYEAGLSMAVETTSCRGQTPGHGLFFVAQYVGREVREYDDYVHLTNTTSEMEDILDQVPGSVVLSKEEKVHIKEQIRDHSRFDVTFS